MASISLQDCVQKAIRAQKFSSAGVLENCCLDGKPYKDSGHWLQHVEQGGERVRARMQLVNNAQDAAIWLPIGARLNIRDPHFAGRNLVLTVDDPASLEFVGFKASSDHPLHIRTEGNQAFSKGEFFKAALLYTQCISHEQQQGLDDMVAVYSNRAQAWLKLERFEDALADAEHALRLHSRHDKSWARKAQALMGMQRHVEALACFSRIQVPPGDLQDKCSKMVEQSTSGKYDLSPYILTQGNVIPKFSDFVRDVQIRMTEDGRGRGLFVTRHFQAGELIFVSNALATASSNEELDAALVRACLASTRARKHVQMLLSRKELPSVDAFRPNTVEAGGSSQVDVVGIKKLVGSHSFGLHISGTNDKPDNVGLWVLAALINHSCMQNVSQDFIGTAMFIRASRFIAAGEELTLSYVDPLVPLSIRKCDIHNSGWGFSCKCTRCLFEQQFESKNLAQAYKKFYANQTTDSALEIAGIVEEKLKLSGLTSPQKRWVESSYVHCLRKSRRGIPYEELLEAAYEVAPGQFSVTNLMIDSLGMGHGGSICEDAAGRPHIRPQGKALDLLVAQMLSRYGKQPPEFMKHMVAMAVEMFEMWRNRFIGEAQSGSGSGSGNV